MVNDVPREVARVVNGLPDTRKREARSASNQQTSPSTNHHQASPSAPKALAPANNRWEDAQADASTHLRRNGAGEAAAFPKSCSKRRVEKERPRQEERAGCPQIGLGAVQSSILQTLQDCNLENSQISQVKVTREREGRFYGILEFLEDLSINKYLMK